MKRPLRTDSLPERAAFAPLPDLATQLARGDIPAGPGHWAEIEPPQTLAGHPAGDVVLVHLRDAVVWPRRGIVMAADGQIVQSTAAGGRITPAQMARLPGMTGGPDAPVLAPRTTPPRLPRAMVWMNAGARGNYGHFIFDALTGLHWADRAGLTGAFVPLAPPLMRWQRDLLRHAGIGTAPREMADTVIAVDHLILTSAQNHYLHRCAGLLDALAAGLDPPRPAAAGNGPPVYLSRRGMTGRIMLGEAALEHALAARGVRILRPGRMTVAAQIAAVQGARAIIGPSGAALANAVFLGQGARLIELRPAPVREPWLDLACANLGLRHEVIPLAGPLPAGAVPLWARVAQLPRRLTGRYHYVCRVDIAATLAALP